MWIFAICLVALQKSGAFVALQNSTVEKVASNQQTKWLQHTNVRVGITPLIDFRAQFCPLPETPSGSDEWSPFDTVSISITVHVHGVGRALVPNHATIHKNHWEWKGACGGPTV